MAFRRRRFAKKKTTRPRRKAAVPRAPRQGMFTIVRRQPTSYISNSSIAGVAQVINPPSGSGLNMIVLGTPVAHPIFGATFSVPFAAAFTLDMLSQYTDLTSISDQYKITNIGLRFQYNASDVTGVPIGASQPAFVPIVKYIPDYDDGSIETIFALQAKMGLRSVPLSGGKFHSMRLSPRVADTVFGTALVPGYATPSKTMWLDSSGPAVPHYGIKGYIENFPLSGTSVLTSCITIEVVYTVKLKGLQ